MRTKLAALAAVTCSVSLALTGCSSKKSNNAGATTSATSSSASSTPTPTASVSAATEADLKKVVLQASDLPAGWTATPAPTQSAAESTSAIEGIARCLGVKAIPNDQVATVTSQSFVSTAGSQLTSSATSYKSEATVAAHTAMLANPKLESCVNTMIKSGLTQAGQLPAGATISTPVIKITPGHGSGPSNVVATVRASISMTMANQTVPIVVDIAVINGKTTEAQVSAIGLGAAVPADVQAAAVKAVANRVAALG